MKHRHTPLLLLLLLLSSSFLALMRLSTGQQETLVTNALTWLKNNQNADGSWGGTPGSITSIFQATSAVLEALHYLRINYSTYQKGTQWILNQNVTNVDYVSRKAETMSEAGHNASDMINWLMLAENDDGGWGLDKGQSSDILDTILAIKGLSASYVADSTLKQGVTYILVAQNDDGGYGLHSGDTSNVYYTSIVMSGLEEFVHTTFLRLDDPIQHAAAWLASQQQGYGGWIEEGNATFQSSLATSALKKAGYPFNETAAENWILASQKPDDSWGSDPYETALALMAIGRPPFDNPPQAAFSFTPKSPMIGQPIQFVDASNDSDGTVTRWHWSFGDGGTSQLQNPTHQYTLPGSYNITLGVTDDADNIDFSSQVVNVTTRPSNTPFQNGDVLIGVGGGLVKQFNSNGTLVSVLNTTSGSREDGGMVFDTEGNLYTCDFTESVVSKFNIYGQLINHPWGGPFGLLIPTPWGGDLEKKEYPETVVVDAAGNLYVGEGGNEQNGVYAKLREFNPAGDLLATWVPAREKSGIDDIDLAADQHTIFYTSEGNSIKRFDIANNTQLPDFATLPDITYHIRIRSNGEILVATPHAVYRLDSEGNIIQNYTADSLGDTGLGYSGDLFALCLDPDGKSFWTGDYETGWVYRVDIATGAVLKTFDAGLTPNVPSPGSTLGGFAIFNEPRVGLQPLPLNVWPTDASGNPKSVFKSDETVYATVHATGQQVTFYLSPHQGTWSNGTTLSEVSVVNETIVLNQGSGNQTVQVWKPPLQLGSYDIIVDLNKNGVYDAGLDLIDSVPAGFYVILPYNVTINAYNKTQPAHESIIMDGFSTFFDTPYTFTGLSGTHTFTVPDSDSGVIFRHWSTGSINTTITVETGGTYTAYYAPAQQLNLFVDVSGSGTTNATSWNTYNAGTVISVQASPDTGWTFDHWLLNNTNVGQANPYTLTINANYNLTAVFTKTGIPEFPSITPLLLLMIAITATIILKRRMRDIHARDLEKTYSS